MVYNSKQTNKQTDNTFLGVINAIPQIPLDRIAVHGWVGLGD